MLTLHQIAPSPYLPAGETPPPWADYAVVTDDDPTRLPFQLHRLTTAEWQDLEDLHLGTPADDASSLSELFLRIADATGGVSGNRTPPTDPILLLAHLRNWLHLWRCVLHNADAHASSGLGEVVWRNSGFSSCIVGYNAPGFRCSCPSSG